MYFTDSSINKTKPKFPTEKFFKQTGEFTKKKIEKLLRTFKDLEMNSIFYKNLVQIFTPVVSIKFFTDIRGENFIFHKVT